MRITLKLYATLADYLPAQRQGNKAEIELPEGSSVQAAIDSYKLPEKLTHLVLVDGHYVSAEERASRILQEGDVLAIWPPIAGG